MSTERINITINFTRQPPEPVSLMGRQFLRVPITMIVPGVLNGSRGPLLFPEDEVIKSPHIWNNMPIVLEHPTDEQGQPLSARDPGVLEAVGLGMLLNSRAENRSLRSDGLFDIDRTLSRDAALLDDICNLRPIEVSTGLDLDAYPIPGVFNRVRYSHVARNFAPDHLAVLRGGKRGACSVRDGCGVNNQEASWRTSK